MHLAGATVLRGPIGFGHSSRLHTAKILRLSEDLPIVIEIVDAEEKINAFLDTLDTMMPSGLVTLEKVKVLQYGSAMATRSSQWATTLVAACISKVTIRNLTLGDASVDIAMHQDGRAVSLQVLRTVGDLHAALVFDANM